MIYLDHNATTPVRPEVFEAMQPWFVERFGNPSSAHPSGRAAATAVEEARAQVAGLIGANPEEIIFTGGGTEASNLAIHGTMTDNPRRGLAISAIEHPATASPAQWLAERDVALQVLPVGPGGQIQHAPLAPDTALVSVMHANNETGGIQPVRELAEEAHRVGAVVHTDAAQSAGKIPVDVDALGVDLLTLAGHKLYAPKGVGALYIRKGVSITPWVRGAGHERGLRPGTENVPAIVGLGMAAALAQRDLDTLNATLTRRTTRLWHALEGVAVRTGSGPWLPNTLHVRFHGVSGNALLARCPEISASTGSACHAQGETPSSVLLAMGIPEPQALGAVRLSLGRSTTDDDVDRAAAALLRAFRNLRDSTVS